MSRIGDGTGFFGKENAICKRDGHSKKYTTLPNTEFMAIACLACELKWLP